jgi:hypothetical protein
VQGIRLFAALLAALVICGTGIAVGAQDDGSAAADPSTAAALSAAPPDEGVELKSKRTAVSDTFRLPSGALETRISPSPINYSDAEGEYRRRVVAA